MRSVIRQLYMFMASCGGNWRNSIYIDDPARPNDGIMMAFDWDARPVSIRAGKLRELSGEGIDVSECHAKFSAAVFRELFGQFLLWNTVTDGDDPFE